MNILIKNSDFSQVSIGTVGELPLGSVLTNMYFSPLGVINYIENFKGVCIDLSQSGATKVKIHSYQGTSKVLGAFYSGTMPSDTTFANNTQAIAFDTSMNCLGYFGLSDSGNGFYTVVENIPEGTNTLILNMGLNDVSNAWAIELFS